MSLTSSTQAQIAFKNLNGKSQTDLIKGLVNEPYGISFNISKDNVWLDNISNTVSLSILQGTTVKVTANLTPIPGSNGHSYFTNWPTLPPTGVDIKTGLSFNYGVGSLIGISPGDRLIGIISDSYGLGYGVIPYDSIGNFIPSLDVRTWIYQYNSGIFYQEYTTYTTPLTIDVYPYIGSKLAPPNTQQNIRVSALGTNSYYTSVSNPIISTYSSNYLFLVDFQNSNTSGTVSLNIDGIGTASLVQYTSSGKANLLPGDIIGGTAGPIYYLNYNGGVFQFYKANPSQNAYSYTNISPTINSIGGIDSNTSFNNVLIQDVFSDLLYSNQLDTFGGISLIGPSGTVSSFHSGDTMNAGSYTFSWIMSDSSKFKENSLNIIDNIYDDMNGSMMSSNIVIGASISIPYNFTIGSTVSGTHSKFHRDFYISIGRANGTNITKKFIIPWYDRLYYGEYNGLTVSFSGLTAMSSQIIYGSSFSNCLNTYGSGYKYISFPDEVNELSDVYYKNMPVAIAGDVDGYTYSNLSHSDLNWTILPVTIYGVTKNYKVYRTLNIINGTFSLKIK